MRRFFLLAPLGLSLLSLVSVTPCVGSIDLPSPASVIGFRPGTERSLADWTQIVDYFGRLDRASGRIRVAEVGKSTQGRPFLVVTITSEGNFSRLEEIRRDNLRLADPRGLSDGEAARLISQGKTIVVLQYGVHSLEVAGPQTAMEMAYTLASGEDPTVLDILDKTVIIMVPCVNPDGQSAFVEWYRKTLGTDNEGGPVPFPQHPFVGEDVNRDWYMLTQSENRLVVEHVLNYWHPQILQDIHQMSALGARIFVPPFRDPWEPNVDPALISATNAIGAHMAAKLITEGKTGVVFAANYDAWTPARAYPQTHGGVRILTECAVVAYAGSVDFSREDLQEGLGYDPRKASWNFPVPWPGGTWTLRDVVDYQLASSWALLDHAGKNREFWLTTFHGVLKRACERASPYAVIIPGDQRDGYATARMVDALRDGGVEVHRARTPFQAEGRTFSAGSFVVLMAQPASAHAKSLLERQDYPDLRQFPGGPPVRTGDCPAHTLPLLLGVETVTAASPFVADLIPTDRNQRDSGRIEGRGRYYALAHRTGEMKALGRLLKAGVKVLWTRESVEEKGRSYPQGTLLVPAAARSQLEPLCRDLGLVARGVRGGQKAEILHQPRIGMYLTYEDSPDEGWTRFIFEREMDVAYSGIRNREIRAGNLRQKYDVILLPSLSPGEMRDGMSQRSHIADEYKGGIGGEGIAALRDFVKNGGTLIAINRATELLINEFPLPVKNVLAATSPEKDEPDRFYCPGSILGVKIDANHPISSGLDENLAIWFERSPAFQTDKGNVVARYVSDNPLLSGWLIGGQHLKNQGALVEVPLGEGRVVLFGFRPTYRAQAWGTYVALLNAIYTSGLVQAKGGD